MAKDGLKLFDPAEMPSTLALFPNLCEVPVDDFTLKVEAMVHQFVAEIVSKSDKIDRDVVESIRQTMLAFITWQRKRCQKALEPKPDPSPPDGSAA